MTRTSPVHPLLSAASFAPQLPATLEDLHISLPILRPGHGTWRVWLVDGAHTLAINAQQVIDSLNITDPAIVTRYPIDWTHERTSPKTLALEHLYLWSHSTLARLLVTEYANSTTEQPVWRAAQDLWQWLKDTHHGLCVEDPQRTLDEALPTRHSYDGKEYPVAAAALHLAFRYGAQISRNTIFQLMEQLGWTERDEQAHWTLTLKARARELAYSRNVRTPKGSYAQIFITTTGLTELANTLEQQLNPPLVDLTQEEN